MTNHVDLAHFFEFKQTKCVNRLRIIFGLMANNGFNNAVVVSCCAVLFWHCIFLRRNPIFLHQSEILCLIHCVCMSRYINKGQETAKSVNCLIVAYRFFSLKKTLFHRIIKQSVENEGLMCLRNPEISIMLLFFLNGIIVRKLTYKNYHINWMSFDNKIQYHCEQWTVNESNCYHSPFQLCGSIFIEVAHIIVGFLC